MIDVGRVVGCGCMTGRPGETTVVVVQLCVYYRHGLSLSMQFQFQCSDGLHYQALLVPQALGILGFYLPVKAICPGACRCTAMTLEDDLTAAAALGNTGRVESLLRAGAAVNGANSLGRAALQVMMMGSVSVAQVLLQQGADPNVADRRTGATPLHDAARTGFLDTVRLLVQYEADPQARDYSDCRPVDLARMHGHTEVVNFLESVMKP
ncbi:hypothetical protein L3Q82_005359 [Scortum barcoo]|uniref:Uncharacterized protein n=1 Tax=Scortum barcoo TaxID=214431 RepID=A0ACB8VA02_9TELE|nr:hypothetical protein L3Q82_005359 [Scortum barcoo]